MSPGWSEMESSIQCLMNTAKTPVEFESKQFNNEVFDVFFIVEDDRVFLMLCVVMLVFLLLNLKFVFKCQFVRGNRQ